MLRDTIKKILNEATTDGGSSGTYSLPLQPGLRIFKDSQMGAFTEKVSDYDDAMLNYDSLDGKMDVPKKVIDKLEKRAKKMSKNNVKHPKLSDDDGDILNNQNIKEWVEITENTVVEDLGVWFGTKKKPKGSKQPKGPWVNICRKKEGGGHPPCGRPDASSKGYPKCRAAGVAAKMTDAQKKSACQQKRRAEKSNPKSGTGNQPTMVSYKPKKSKNESIDRLIKKVLMEKLNNQD